MTGFRSRVRRFVSWRYLRWALAFPAVPLVLWACNSHPLQEPLPQPELQNDQYYDVNPNRDIDILFMVDNSPSMREEQDSLARNFPRMIAELERIQGGLPNVHIGVISSDLGGGANSPGGNCSRPGGDRGHLQVKAGCGLDPAMAKFLVSLQGAGGQRMTNFAGDLGQVFGCLATLGDQGCGFEHQLESVRQALADTEMQNTGFLRPTAYLALILITDEDDCSAPLNTNLFGENRMGEAASLRCATEGHLCNGNKPPVGNFSTAVTNCQSNENGQLSKVQDFVNFVRGLKPNRPDQVIVSGIFGWPDPAGKPDGYSIGQRMESNGTAVWDLLRACEARGFGSATAGIRMKKFVDSFGDNGTQHTICSGDFGPAMKQIGEKLRAVLDNTCISAPLLDRDLQTDGIQADCQVSDRVIGADGRAVDTPLPHCSTGRMPCWQVQPDTTCAGTRSKIDVNRGGAMAPAGTQQVIKCRTCARADDPRCPPPA